MRPGSERRSGAILLLACLAAATTAIARVEAATLYAGSYTSGTSKGIYAWRFDDATGAVTPLGLAAETPQPAHLWPSPDGHYLYAVNWESEGGVSAFRIDALTSRLTFLNRVTTRGTRPNQVVLDPCGRVAAAVNYATGNVVLYRVLSDGRLSDPIYEDRHTGPARSAFGNARAHGIAFSRDGRTMYVAELGLDRVYSYRIDPKTAQARASSPPFLDLHAGSGPRRLQLSADDRFLYVNHETDSEVSVLSTRNGRLSELQRISTLPPNVATPNMTAEIVLSADGRTLYVGNRGHDTIATFHVDRRTGRLTALGYVPAGGAVPRNLLIDPSGRFLLSANEKSGTITELPIDRATGLPGPARVIASLDTPGGMAFVATAPGEKR
jgi:6-phosphogluconolactonase